MGIAFSEPVVEPPPMTTEERAKAEAELIKERKKFFMKQARVMEREIEKLEEDAKEKRLRIMEDAKSKAKGLEDKNVRELIKQYIWSKVRRRAARQSGRASGQRSGGAAERRRSAHFRWPKAQGSGRRRAFTQPSRLACDPRAIREHDMLACRHCRETAARASDEHARGRGASP